jgi:hypothetical protein
MNSYLERRKTQLARQEMVDKKLSNLHCQDLVLAYFYQQRELNRKLTEECYNTAFYNMPTVLNRHLEIIDRDLGKMDGIFGMYPCPCDLLKEYIGKK